MFESATTSLQIHLQRNSQAAVRAYNASLLVAAPLVALAANSPFLFQHRLWDETRIPLFEQAVAIGERRRVTFGSAYIQASLYECFEENLLDYPVLLPALFQEDPARMNHLRLHNGTIWRWNRPLIGINTNGARHLRIEQRVAAAGPTFPDIMAHLAFSIGLTHALSTQATPPEQRLLFHQARNNFYHCARDSFHAEVMWTDQQRGSMQALLLNRLLTQAAQGLRQLEVDPEHIDYYLNGVLRERTRTGQNGAHWQRCFLAKYPNDWQGLVQAYYEHQESQQPVHTWEV